MVSGTTPHVTDDSKSGSHFPLCMKIPNITCCGGPAPCAKNCFVDDQQERMIASTFYWLMGMDASRSSWDTLRNTESALPQHYKECEHANDQRCVARPTLPSLTDCLTMFVHTVCLVLGLCESHLIFVGADDKAKYMIHAAQE
jgi:hypothetical protein